ncbi:MAG: hypothetical protein KF739_00950 [Cryobacterium sp.]|nr:hypothetical protein [Cryobacterium sp.]
MKVRATHSSSPVPLTLTSFTLTNPVQPLGVYQTPEFSLQLSQGDHTVVVELAGPSHQALLPAQTVSFVVR